MQIRTRFVATMFSVMAVAACGDEDGDGGGGGSGVSSSRKVADLSAAEAKQVCQGLQKKFDRIAAATDKLVCVSGAVAIAEDAAECNSAVDDCLEEPQDPGDFDIGCDEDSTGAGVPDGCENVTVGQLEACVEATAKLSEDAADEVSCSSTEDDLAEIDDRVSEYPDACNKLGDGCDLFDDT